MRPEARQDKLLIQELGDEIVVYDRQRHRVHLLNRTAALVWRNCDGQKTVTEMAALLQNDLNLPAADEDEELVWLALDRLDKAHLLRERITPPPDAATITRRHLMQKMVLATLLPIVTSIIAPTPAMARSGSPQCSGACGVVVFGACLGVACPPGCVCRRNGPPPGGGTEFCTCRNF